MTKRVAIVTGAAQGIGADYARGLAADGMAVVVADIKTDAARATAEAIRAAGGEAVEAHVDITEPSSAADLAGFVRNRFGRLDVLVNNAAMFEGNQQTTAMEVKLDYWRRMFQVNVDGALIMIQALAPLMIENGWGRIVNQSSTAAYMFGGDPYGITKAALITLTLGLASELGPKGVTVNAIAPGPIPTAALLGVAPQAVLDRIAESSAIARLGTTDDLLHALRYLVSENASWVTGQTLCVDGGWIKRF
jgi:NAD(P)-dependent dehydrogenase (short-subunit alcohol dehydrogenase family)